jgi:hypothetical protein
MFLYMGSGGALAASVRNRRIRALMECSYACGAVSRPGLGADGVDPAVRAGIIPSAGVCEELCRRTASLMARRSERVRLITSICAEACRRCAEVCELVEDAAHRECARRCRECEAICRGLEPARPEEADAEVATLAELGCGGEAA